jgi:flagellar hook-associated protein 2
MAGITTSVGLISGLNYADLVDQLIAVDRRQVDRLQEREKQFQARSTALAALSANLLTLATSAQQMANAKNFSAVAVSNSDAAQLAVTGNDGAPLGHYALQSLKLASAHQLLSRGFANADTQTLGAGSLVITSGGRLDSQTRLAELNDASGVRRGVIRITDRSGASADVDLSSAATVSDVIEAINRTEGIRVQASLQGEKFAIIDHTGQTAFNLSVTDKSGGFAAADLGLNKSVAADVLAGNAVFAAGSAKTLATLDDGNGLYLSEGLADLRVTLSDAATTTIDVDLNGAVTLGDVVSRINNHAANGGKLTAQIQNGRLRLVDNTGGGGGQPLSASNINGAIVTRALGLDTAAEGGTLNGRRLSAGMNSVLLRSLRGGQGIGTLGTLSLTDRAGRTAQVNLSAAESLDEVLAAINDASDAFGVKLQLEATIDASGGRLSIRDTSGSTASNLVVADVGGATLAADLGISVNAAQSSVTSNALQRRFVAEAASLSSYAPGSANVRRGSFTMIDSTGSEVAIAITDAAKTIGDVMAAINAATGGSVVAQLNQTGDGFELVDHAGGAGQLQVRELGGATAADLRILGTGAPGIDGKSRIQSRLATLVTIDATDTLGTLQAKLNASGAGLTAALIDDGSAVAPKRLVLTAGATGVAGRFVLDDGGVGLGLAEQSRGEDAVLRMGADPARGFLFTSSSNRFDAAAPGLAIDLKSVGERPALINVARDSGKVIDLVRKFVEDYNAFARKLAELSRFDTNSNTAAPLQGEGIALRLSGVLTEMLVDDQYGPSNSRLRALTQLGVTFAGDGTLLFDGTELQQALDGNAGDVGNFFLDAATGFAARLKKTVESFTDPLTGHLTEESNSLKDSVDAIETKIAALNATLETRRERLMRQFINLESILSQLQTQQSALSSLQNLASLRLSNNKSRS